MYQTTFADPDAPGCQALLKALSDALQRITGSSGQASFSTSDGQQMGSCFALARSAEGIPVAWGAIRPVKRGIAELKRMYARPGTQGGGSAVLAFLENQARQFGYGQMWLETRKINERAVAFYARHGYQPITSFGRYMGRPEAVSMGKRLLIAGIAESAPVTATDSSGPAIRDTAHEMATRALS